MCVRLDMHISRINEPRVIIVSLLSEGRALSQPLESLAQPTTSRSFESASEAAYLGGTYGAAVLQCTGSRFVETWGLLPMPLLLASRKACS